MIVLGLTTSTPRIGVAIGDDDGVRASWGAVRGRHHAELITPAIRQVCRAADLTMADISAVAVDTGPGLFTGLRIGVATAKACAFALDVGVVTVSSLDLVAFAFRHSERRITVALDARRSELFVASYRSVPGGIRQISEARTATPVEVAADLQAEPGPHLVVGDGARAHPEVFAANDRIGVAEVSHPSAEVLVRLGVARAAQGKVVPGDQVRCTYLREPDAEINWITRDGGVHRDDGAGQVGA